MNFQIAKRLQNYPRYVCSSNSFLRGKDERLRERSEKLSHALSKQNEVNKENVKLKKRLETEQAQNKQHKMELTDCRVDLEKVRGETFTRLCFQSILNQLIDNKL